MNADGTGETRLTDEGGASPAVSSDGTRIAFDRLRDGSRDPFVMNADGSSQTNITNDANSDTQPVWSPDGTRIAFTSAPTFRQADSHAMNADGTGRENLTGAPGSDSLADWSPDGSRIAFHSQRDGNFEVYVMDADGGNQHNLTSSPSGDSSPAWSPDGTKIAFTSNRDGGDGDLHVMDVDGTNVVELLNSLGGDNAADWSTLLDSDGDGLPDDRDPDTVGDAVDALADGVFHAPGHRTAIRSRLDDAEADIAAGDTGAARRTLLNLRRHLDGCQTDGAADHDDWDRRLRRPGRDPHTPRPVARRARLAPHAQRAETALGA